MSRSLSCVCFLLLGLALLQGCGGAEAPKAPDATPPATKPAESPPAAPATAGDPGKP